MGDLLSWLLASIPALHVTLLAPVSLAVAIAVSIHVLLNKRDIGASIGWIGLAWLSPLAGGALYFVFGINRVRRRAQRMRTHRQDWGARGPGAKPLGRDDHLARLEHAGRRITGRTVQTGNAVRIFHNGDEAYPPMLAAIAEARSSIALSTYILRNDAAGGRFIAALGEAKARGVEVCVLVDGVGSGYFLSPAYRALRRAGVPTGRFMHSLWPWRMPFLNLRTHKKLLLIDGTIGFTGGMNLADENVLASQPRHPVRDTHFRFDGPVVAQLTEAFARDWSFVMGREMDDRTWFPPLAASGDATARVVTSGPDQDLEKIEYLVLEAIACARRSICLATPYFLPDERLTTALAMAAMRGVKVDIILPRQSNHRMVDWATRANIAPLLHEGCRVWLNPPPFDHTKLMVVDGQWSLIGSANWDMRSFRLNFELVVEAYDTALAERLTTIMHANKGLRMTMGDLLARRLPTRLRDAGVRLMLPYL